MASTGGNADGVRAHAEVRIPTRFMQIYGADPSRITVVARLDY